MYIPAPGVVCKKEVGLEHLYVKYIPGGSMYVKDICMSRTFVCQINLYVKYIPDGS